MVLWRNKHKLFFSPKLKVRYGILYLRYEESYYFWELTEMTRNPHPFRPTALSTWPIPPQL